LWIAKISGSPQVRSRGPRRPSGEIYASAHGAQLCSYE
jgi:hypothetical protein